MIQKIIPFAFLAIIYTSSLMAQSPLFLRPDSTAGKDALIHGLASQRNSNFGSNIQFPAHAGTIFSTPFLARGLMEFDLSSIPSGMKIDSAFLSLYAFTNTGGFGMHRNSSGPNGAWLRRITSAWNENTVTWNNAPSFTTINQVELAPSTSATQNYSNIDVTALIQDMIENPSHSHGFQLMLQDENHYRTLNFYTSDVQDSTLRPTLEIYYSRDSITSILLKPNASNGKDALIHELASQRNTNFGTNVQLPAHAGTISSTPFLARGLIDFNLSAIPTGMKVDSAFLSLYAYSLTNGFGFHRKSSGPNRAWLRRITSSWSESTVTWNNAPTYTNVNQVALDSNATIPQDYLVDVTTLVQDMIANPSTSFGFQLMLQNENFYRTLNFYSSDASNSAYHPDLRIYYSPILTSIEEQSTRIEDFVLFPNPSKDHFRLNFSESNKNYQVSILDVTSKTIKIVDDYRNSEIIDVQDLSNGIYFIKVSDGKNILLKKLLIH